MTTSSSSAAEKKLIHNLWKQFFIVFAIILIFGIFLYLNKDENNTYIIKTLELSGSIKEGDTLFKMNCVGCHGITARGLVGPDLHSITHRLNDSAIIKQVIEAVSYTHLRAHET